MATIICDLDGTLFDIDHRLPYLEAKDWDKFYEAVKDDTPYIWCQELLHAMTLIGHKLVFITGRNDIARDETERQLKLLGFDDYKLEMRPESFRIPDYKFKQMVYRKKFKDEAIIFVLEDRQQVVDMWRKEGLVVLQCAAGAF